MSVYELVAAPQFITKYSSMDEVRSGLLNEYETILRYFLTTQPVFAIELWSLQGEQGCHFAYEFDAGDLDVLDFLAAHDRVLRLRESSAPATESLGVTSLHRSVDLVPVGAVDRAQTTSLPVLPLSAPRYTNFDPNVVGQSTLTQVIFAPVTQMAGALVRDRFTPDIAYLAPIPRPLSLNATPNHMWRSTLRSLSQMPGRVRMACRPYNYTDDDIDYALLCLQYYLGTHAARLSGSDVDSQTAMLRGISTRQPAYIVDISVEGEDPSLRGAFLQDTDGEAFASAPTPLERALADRALGLAGRRDRTATPQRGSLSESPARKYGKLFTLDQLCRLLLPPFTLKDALPGTPHYVPRPFQDPYLPPLSDKATLSLGARTGGVPVDIPLQQLTRHAFVTGASGTGKTNSLMHIIRQVHQHGVPLLIVDPAKRDFEPLMLSIGQQNRIFDFEKAWVRFNPFIPPANIPLYAHAVVLAKTLSMLFPTNAVAHEMLLGLVKEAYWVKLSNARPPESPLTMEFFAQKTGADLRSRPYLAPTFDDFLDNGLTSLERAATTSQSQFAREAFDHFERRWSNLRRSLISIALRPAHPTQTIDPLFAETSLVELGGWFDQDEANAMFALVFSMLYEQRLSDAMAAGGHSQELTHVAVLDEAHRIVPAEVRGGDPSLMSAGSQASGLLSQMIAECRALGQGLILAEQSAGNISSQVLINTSTKLVHSVFFGRDKEFLKSALSLSGEEEDFLAYLEVGEALAFTGRTYQPLLVRVPKQP